MNNKLFEIITDIDCVHAQLEELDTAFGFLDDEMDRGYQSEEDFLDWKAKLFVLRLPRCQALLHTLQGELRARTKELEVATEALLELKKQLSADLDQGAVTE